MAGISKINSTKAQQALASLINNDAEMEIKTEHITLSTVGSPTYKDLESFINNYMPAGKFTGGGHGFFLVLGEQVFGLLAHILCTCRHCTMD